MNLHAIKSALFANAFDRPLEVIRQSRRISTAHAESVMVGIALLIVLISVGIVPVSAEASETGTQAPINLGKTDPSTSSPGPSGAIQGNLSPAASGSSAAPVASGSEPKQALEKSSSGAPTWTYVVGSLVALGGLLWTILSGTVLKKKDPPPPPADGPTASGNRSVVIGGSAGAVSTGEGQAVHAEKGAQVSAIQNSPDATITHFHGIDPEKFAQQQAELILSREREKGLRAELEKHERLLAELRGAVNTVNQVASAANATAADRQAAELLAKGDASGAVTLLGRQAEAAEKSAQVESRKAADLYRQQAALLRATDSRAALAAYERALALDPDDAMTLWKAGDLARITGRTGRAKSLYMQTLNAVSAEASADPDNTYWQRVQSIIGGKLGEILVAQGDLKQALANFEKLLMFSEKLTEIDPSNTEWQRDVVVSHNKIGDVQLLLGNPRDALVRFQAAMAISKKFAEMDPSNEEWQRDLSISHERIGDVQLLLGNPGDALVRFQAAMAISKKFAEMDPSNKEWQRDLSISHERIGGVQVAQGNLKAALDSFQLSMAIRTRITGSDPNNTVWQRDLSIGYERIGGVQLAQRNLKAALESFRNSMAIRIRLADADPGNAEWQLDLSRGYVLIGDAQLGNPTAAQLCFQAAMEILRTLAESGSSNTHVQRDLSIVHIKLGNVQAAQGDFQAALAHYLNANAISKKLAEADPDNVERQRDLFVSHSLISDVQVAQGELTEALLSRQTILAINKKLAKADPDKSGLQRDLLVSHSRLGGVQVAIGDLEAALASFSDSLTIATRLADADPGSGEWQHDLAISLGRVASIGSLAGSRTERRQMLEKAVAIARDLEGRGAGTDGDVAWLEGLLAKLEAEGE